MKKFFLFILSITLMGMFSVKAQTVVPTTSTDGAETWYYMKLVPRDAANPQNMWATVMPDDTLKTTAFTGGAEQLWKVVENGTGIALVNKLNGGRYMDVDYSMNAESKTTPGSVFSSRIRVTNTKPTNALRFVESSGYDFSGLSPVTVPGWTATSKAVFIVDNSVTEVAADNKLTFKTTGGAPFSFVLSSYGAPMWGPRNIPAWGNGNHNQLVQFRTQAEVTADLKVVLAASIAKATATLGKATVGEKLGDIKPELKARLQSVLDQAQAAHDAAAPSVESINLATEDLNGLFGFYKNIETANTLLKTTSIGYNPGQFSQDVVDGLVSITDYAQEVASDAGSTKEDMDGATVELLAIISAFTNQVNLPELSSSVDHWYYIQGTRPANSYLTAGEAGAGTQVKSLAVIPNETQLWRLVKNAEGFALQNKATSEYLQTDFPTGTNLSTQASMPVLPLMFKGSTQTTNNALRFLIENITGATPAYRLHAGAAGNNWGLMNWTGDANDNSSWLFLSENELFRSEFKIALAAAKAIYVASVEGIEFGQFTAETRSTFNDLIVAGEAKDLSAMSQEELTAATLELKEAVVAFECNKDLATLASFTEMKWFRFVNNMQPQTGYAGNKAMSAGTRLVDQKFTFETIDKESDAQLFRFELNADKTAAIAIVNKAAGMYVGSDGMILSENPSVTFEITSLDAFSFWIKPTDAAPLHAAASNSDILNWNASAGSASAWRIEFVKSEPVTDFVTPFQKALANAYVLFEDAAQLQGNKIGQYTRASVEAFAAVINEQEVKDPATMTKEQLITAIDALIAGPQLLVVNTDVKLLENTNPALSYDWYRIINDQSVGTRKGMAMSVNGRIVDETTPESLTWEAVDEYSDAQLFRFELNAAKTHVLNIYNKAAEAYVDANGKLASASTEGNEFEIVQLAKGRSFWIHPTLETLVEGSNPEEFVRLAPLHAQEVGAHIVNWEDGAGSASAWVFDYAYTEYTNSLSEINDFNFKVRVNKGVVTVQGVENFEVYSITGQKQNHKAALKGGVYIVKLNNMTQKLVIR